MNKNKITKIGVLGFLAAVGVAAYTAVKKSRIQQEQEVIDITPNDNAPEGSRK